MNADDRAHWLDPSPPLAVDGEDPADPPRRVTLAPADGRAEQDDATDDLARDSEHALGS